MSLNIHTPSSFPKLSDNFKVVVDYRVLNQRSEVESVLFADLYSEFHWFGKAQFVTTLDLNHAYHQIPLAKASCPLTAFFTN
jgi:hypothetical protein